MTQKPLECSDDMFIKHLVKLSSRHVDCILYCCCSYCHGFVCKCTLVGASGLKAINKNFELLNFCCWRGQYWTLLLLRILVLEINTVFNLAKRLPAFFLFLWTKFGKIKRRFNSFNCLFIFSLISFAPGDSFCAEVYLMYVELSSMWALVDICCC